MGAVFCGMETFCGGFAYSLPVWKRIRERSQGRHEWCMQSPGKTEGSHLPDIEMLVKELQQFLSLAKRKPYISYWGEVFYILHSIKKKANELRTTVSVYDIWPAGKIVYDIDSRCFVALLPELSIKFRDNEFVDALLDGRFVPKTE
jgi:hypothetical protein